MCGSCVSWEIPHILAAVYQGGGDFVDANSQSLGSDLYQIWNGDNPFISVPTRHVSDFKCVVSFPN